MPPRGIRRYLPQREKFADGYTEAKHAIVAVAIVGEVLQGGLVFGWNALALMLQRLGNFAGKCADVSEGEPLALLMPRANCCERAFSCLQDPGQHQQGCRGNTFLRPMASVWA